MSDSTDVNREQSGTSHRSRREQRKAERAAEREAYPNADRKSVV